MESSSITSKIRFVLVETSHSGNIGSSARAMKTMGINKLYLVKPQNYTHDHACALAVHAADLVENAVHCESLNEAISDCSYVIGTTARTRNLEWTCSNSRAFTKQALNQASKGEIAIIMGREKSGLTNEELELCDLRVHIPTSDYSSLNLAQAVQILAYELKMSQTSDNVFESDGVDDESLASKQELDGLMQHTKELLEHAKIIDANNPKSKLLARLRKIYTKASLELTEINIFRGIFAAILKKK